MRKCNWTGTANAYRGLLVLMITVTSVQLGCSYSCRIADSLLDHNVDWLKSPEKQALNLLASGGCREDRCLLIILPFLANLLAILLKKKTPPLMGGSQHRLWKTSSNFSIKLHSVRNGMRLSSLFRLSICCIFTSDCFHRFLNGIKWVSSLVWPSFPCVYICSRSIWLILLRYLRWDKIQPLWWCRKFVFAASTTAPETHR